MDTQSDAIDAMLSALDADLEYSRSVMRAMEERNRDVDWETVKSKVRERHGDCPVCLREIDDDECEVTSCGHAFHTQCLESWLRFCGGQDKPPTCPVCRAMFQHCALVEKPPEQVRAKKEREKAPKRPRDVSERKRWK
jgi:hypothetical protein